MVGGERGERRRLRLGDHDDGEGLTVGDQRRKALEERRDAAVEDRDLLLRDALRSRKGDAETRGVGKGRKCDDPFGPGLPRRERDRDLGDDAVDAVSVEDLPHVLPFELDDAR